MFSFTVCSVSVKRRDSPEPCACHPTRYQKITVASEIMRYVKHVRGSRPVRGSVARHRQVQDHERACSHWHGSGVFIYIVVRLRRDFDSASQPQCFRPSRGRSDYPAVCVTVVTGPELPGKISKADRRYTGTVHTRGSPHCKRLVTRASRDNSSPLDPPPAQTFPHLTPAASVPTTKIV